MDRKYQDSNRRMPRGKRDMSDNMNRDWQFRRDSNNDMGDLNEDNWRFQDQDRYAGGSQGNFDNDLYGSGPTASGRDWGHGYSGRSDNWRHSGGGRGGHGHHEKGLGQRAMEKLGEFFGKGPKGYKRSDDRIREDVNECLWRHPSIDASELEVEVKEAIVTLRGQVDSRRTRRLVEETIEDLPGVSDVIMEVRVATRGSDANWSGSATIPGTSAQSGSYGSSQSMSSGGRSGGMTTGMHSGSSMGGELSQQMSSDMGGGLGSDIDSGMTSGGSSKTARQTSRGSSSKSKSRKRS